MKYFAVIIILFCVTVNGQFKKELENQVDWSDGITNHQPSEFFMGFINPENFSMKHSLSMSYSAMGNQGISLGVYTNTISYKFNEDLDFSMDASLVTSPYNTLGEDFTKQLNGVYITRAELNYKPADNMNISLQFNRLPVGMNPYGYYRSPLWR